MFVIAKKVQSKGHGFCGRILLDFRPSNASL
jgi:hypothetical protein